MPAVNDVGKPCAGEPHARIDGRELETEHPGHGVKKNSRAGNRSAHSGFATYSQDLPPRQLSTLHSVVSQVLGTERSHLNPVREALRADDGALHHRLLSIREEAGLPEEISALRVFDVIVWMDGKNRGLGERSELGR
ncbi:DUF6308 family protein [Rhodococcus jostii]|uniref:Uncharacterized protein n=1 Tax=Rhodococcus jostii TaxID=132919 RepID=A0A1H4QHI1_RHOJO|nr:DUF6308 family protein [Rhodococcus jostii]SEC19044.1 hypothetical protein SAMN04490220_1012 [Rhodococcus jostii]